MASRPNRGWSAGPTVALAAVELLRELGHTVPLLVVIDGAPPSVDIGHPGWSEKFRLMYYRLTNATVTLAQLGRDLMRQLHHRSSHDTSFRDAVRSVWQDSAFRPIWRRATGPLAGNVAARLPGKRIPQRHPAETSSDIASLPPDHRGFVATLYDAIGVYVPDADYPGEVVVFESTAEPARSSGNIAKKWVRIVTNVTIVPFEGSHMSIVAEPNGRPLARMLCQKLREVSVRYKANMRQSASSSIGSKQPAVPMAAMLNRNAAHRGDAASPAG
jgi:thioesterase domain-containing protein